MTDGSDPTATSPVRSLLLGAHWWRTKRALLLAAGFSVAVAVSTVAVSSVPTEAVPDPVWWGRHAYRLDTSLARAVVWGPGAAVMVGLAAIHAGLNEGYVPSVVLAGAPSYAYYAVTVPGPRGLVIPVHPDLVFAPVWAARHVVPTAVAFGTLGFLLGLGVREARRRFDGASESGGDRPEAAPPEGT